MSYIPNQEKITVSTSGDLTVAGTVTSNTLTVAGAVTSGTLTTTAPSPTDAISSTTGTVRINGAVITSSGITTTAVTTTSASPSYAITSTSGTVRIAGNIFAESDITAFSDMSVKENIEPIENALDKVTSLTGVTYFKDGKQSVGLIAQNVESVIPEAVLKNGDHLSVAYGNLVGVLIQAIKELNAEIKQLKEKE